MGYVIAAGRCISCNKVFSFNPAKVPSSAVLTGKKEPICAECMQRINLKRIELGLEPVPVATDAYDAADESELDY